MTYPRMLPDADSLARLLLADFLGAGVRVRTEQEADASDHLPLVIVIGRGGPDRHPQFGGLSIVDVHCMTDDSRRGCANLAEACRVGLFTAWRSQTVTAEGHISRVRKLAGPLRIPSGMDAVWRTYSTFELGTRPPRTA